MKGLWFAVVVAIAPGTAMALQQPMPGKADSRIRTVNYSPTDVVNIYSTPGAVMSIQFGEGEKVTNVASSDSHTLNAKPVDNVLFLKFEGCMVPEPMLVLTRQANGKLRHYAFQVETVPQVCSPAGAGTAARSMINASTTASPLDGHQNQNLKLIGEDALSAGHDIDYSVNFKYPGDEAARKREAALAAAARWRKTEADRILKAATRWDTRDPYSGNRNLRYMCRGDAGLMPRWVWDNGYSTVFVYPGLQRMPSLYYVAPDGKELTATYSVHGDTIIAQGTAQEWRVRDGLTVEEIWNLTYNPVGSTPGTGTASPIVQRVLRGADDDR